MALKPQDLMVLLKLAAHPGDPQPYSQLALEVGMSVSEVHAGVGRAIDAGLATKEAGPRPIRAALEEFLVHGVRYAFSVRIGGPARGMPTGFAAPPLAKLLAPSADLPPVWPDPEGEVRGLELSPLYRSAPHAARSDERLYLLLALVDALRIGGARERKIAARELLAQLDSFETRDRE